MEINYRKKFTINGKEYDSIEEVPEPYRALVQNLNDSGKPTSKGLQDPQIKYKINGKEYNSIEEIPEEYRELVQNLKLSDEKQRFNVDGKEYATLVEIPENVRTRFDDQYKNGLPRTLLNNTAEKSANISNMSAGEYSQGRVKEVSPGKYVLPAAILGIAGYLLYHFTSNSNSDLLILLGMVVAGGIYIVFRLNR